MESIGILVIYLLCPIAGLVLTIWSYPDRKINKTKYIFGLSLLLAPILYLLLTTMVLGNHVDKFSGKYSTVNPTNIELTLFSDKTFSLNNNSVLNANGPGKWSVNFGDANFYIKLHFDNDSLLEIFFNVYEEDSLILLGDTRLYRTQPPNR